MRCAGAVGLALMAVACKKDQERPPGPGTFLEADAAVGVELVGAIGPAPRSAVVRAVNSYGAAVSSDPVDVEVDGQTVQVPVDGQGYGAISRDEPGSSRLVADGEEVWLHAVDSSWEGLAAPEAWEAEGTAVAAARADRGMVVATREAVWWVEGEHREPLVRAPSQSAFRGLVVDNVDLDGLRDVVAWTDRTVFLLKGRQDGGFSWAQGIEAAGQALGGVAVGDATDDGTPDLVLAWAGSSGNVFEVLTGNGLWSFTSSGAYSLQGRPVAVALGDNIGEGRPQITVLGSDGVWERFAFASGEWLATGPTVPIGLPPGSDLRSGSDFNGDGGDELYALAPRASGSPRQLFVIDLFGINVEYIQRMPVGAQVHLADGTSDGRTDLWMLSEDRHLHILSWVGATQTEWDVGELPGFGAFAPGSRDDDDVDDVLLLDDALWRWLPGRASDEGTARVWREAPVPVTSVLSGMADAALAEVDGDPGTIDVVGVRHRSARTVIQVWSVQPGTAMVVEHGFVDVGDKNLVVDDFAVCGTHAWLLAEGQLWRADLTTATPTAIHLPVDATRVACGGTGDEEIVTLGGAGLSWLDDSLQALRTEEAPAGAGDVAWLADDSAATCLGEGCRVLPWAPLGEAGSVRFDAQGVAASAGTRSWSWQLAGAPLVGDLDADGHPDLLIVDPTGELAMLRSTGTELGPVERRTLRRDAIAPVGVADLDDDGRRDLWWIDARERLVVTLSRGGGGLEDTGLLIDTDTPNP